MAHLSDETYLASAFDAASNGLGQCAPNPAVGAVIVKNRHIVASGFHRGPGYPHAEVAACSQLGPDFNYADATLYVTLEPCCHVGRTPPCTDYVIEKGFGRVVFALTDPNPKVAGQGGAKLRAAGIVCDEICTQQAIDFYAAYQYWWQTQKPFVIAKLAQSANDKVAGLQGERVEITGASAKTFTHQGRLASDVILTSARTIMQDDPALNVRLKDPPLPRAIWMLDATNRFKLPRQILSTASSLTCVYDEKQPPAFLSALAYCGIKTDEQHRFDLQAVIAEIAKTQVHQVWIEAGPTLVQACLQAGILNRLYWYQSARVLPNDALSGLSLEMISPYVQANWQWMRLGEDRLACLTVLGIGVK